MKRLATFLKIFVMTKSFFGSLLALSVVFSFPFIVSFVSSMFVNLCKEEAEILYGRFDNIIYNAAYEDELDELIKLDNVSNYIDLYGTIEILETNGDLLLGAIDKNAMELGNIHIVKGEFPQNSKEVCVCESLYYELYSDYELGSTLLIGNQNYQLVGLINDYFVPWNKPVQDIEYLYPNVILGESNKMISDRKILLLKNKIDFPAEIYKNQKNIVSNTNVLSGDFSEKYKAPGFIYIALYIVILMLLIYILSLVHNRDNRNVEILNALGIPRLILKHFITCKYLCLSVSAVFGGRLMAELFVYFFIKVYNLQNVTQIKYPDNINNTEKLVFCLLLSIFAILIVSKLNNNEKTKENIIEHIANYHIKDVLWVELLRNYKGVLISAVITSIMLISFLVMSLYLKMYISSKGDVFGKMPVDYDYQFTTNLNTEDYSYTDSDGEIVSVINLPEEESVYYMPSHSNIIDASIINQMSDEIGIYKINNYIESNDIYLNLANKQVNFEYISGYPIDMVINEQIKEVLKLDTNSIYRNSQFCTFPEDEILNLENYEIEGDIDCEKIDAGEEVILVVPVYEKVEYEDGSWGLDFIEYEDYSGKKNQFKDDTFKVGDEIEFLQILPTDSRLMGNLSIEQVKEKTFSKIHHVRIGAILYERVIWFEDASQMPTAYTFIGTEKTLDSIGIEPTYTRTQIYLEEGIDYRNYEPIIYKYQMQLENLNYKNNAAEMQEYRQFMKLLKGLCYLMMSLAAFTMIIIVFTETYTSFLGRREHYTMLRIIGMPPAVYARIFLRRICVVFLLAILLFFSVGFYIVNLIFGSISVISEFLGIQFLIREIGITLGLLTAITILIYSPLLKKYVFY